MKLLLAKEVSRGALALASIAGLMSVVPTALAQTVSAPPTPEQVKKRPADQTAPAPQADASFPTEPASSPETDEGQPGEIVVTGFRQSLADALDAKRDSSGVSDGISAEDIGKSTDQNIAEAMQRVTGVSIDRTDGEGTTITIRGAGASLNNVTLNGVTLTSSSANQAVDFSQFSSDILQSIRINKTASADQNEGSLGGSIVLESFKPLTSKTNRRVLEVQGRYNDFAENKGQFGEDYGDYRLNASFSQRLFNNTLGISLVATREKNTLRRDTYETTGYNLVTYEAATNIKTGAVITGYDYDGNGTISANERGVRGREVRQSTYSYYRNTRDRDSVTGTIQWRPTPSTDIYIDGTYSTQHVVYDESRPEILPGAANPRGRPDLLLWDPDTFTYVQDVFQQAFATANTGNLRLPATIRLYRAEAEQNTENYVIGTGIKQVFGNLTLNLTGGLSRTDFTSDQRVGRATVPRTNNLSYIPGIAFPATAAGQAQAAAAVAANPSSFPGTNNAFYYSGYSCVPNPQICRLVANQGLYDSPAKFQPNAIDLFASAGIDKFKTVNFDADWDVGLGPIVRLSAGGKWEKRSKENVNIQPAQINAQTPGLVGYLTTLNLSDFTEGSTPQWGKRLGFGRDDITDGWFIWDLKKTLSVIEAARGVTAEPPTLAPQGNFTVDSTVWAGYVQADFKMFNDRVFGNLGVRYAKTNVNAGGQSVIQLEQINFLTPENIAYFGSVAAARAALGPNTDNDDIQGAQRVPIATQLVRDTNKYQDWLPSINVNWAVTNKLLARFGASKTIARPPIDLLRPNLTINEAQTSSDSVGTLGGIGLRPYRSTNLDLSLEWYFARNSLLSLAVYNKKLKDFVQQSQVQYYYRDLRSQLFTQSPTRPDYVIANPNATVDLSPSAILLPEAGGDQQAGCFPNREDNLAGARQNPGPPAGARTQCDSLLVTQSENGTGGYVRGVEASFQHNFTWLPGLLSGLGVTANVTYADSLTDESPILDGLGNRVGAIPELPLLGTSKWTTNGTVFYERNGILLRVAYNKRSDYLTTRTYRSNTALWVEGYDTLDVSGSVRLSRNFTVNFQAQNLTDTVQRTYLTSVLDDAGVLPPEGNAFDGNVTKDRTATASNTGRIYRVGLRLTF